MKFADIGLSDELLRAIDESGYAEATPIQAGVIPSVLMMRDIIGIAQTGTGKTASFVLPMIDILAHGRARARMPRSNRSIRRPGVAISTSTPFSSALTWSPICTPPMSSAIDSL